MVGGNNLSSVILAGGFGVRTKNVLGDIPKALIKTSSGETLIDHLLNDLEKAGVKGNHVVSNSKYYPQISKQIEKRGVSIAEDGAKEPSERLGALGDLLLAINKFGLGKESLLVLSSDYAYWESFSLSDFIKFSEEEKSRGCFLTIAWDTGDRSLVNGKFGCPFLDEDGFVISFEEKPQDPKSSLAILAFYLYRPEQIKFLEEFKDQGGNMDSPSNIIPFLMKSGVKIRTFVVNKEVVDAGTPEEIEKAKKY